MFISSEQDTKVLNRTQTCFGKRNTENQIWFGEKEEQSNLFKRIKASFDIILSINNDKATAFTSSCLKIIYLIRQRNSTFSHVVTTFSHLGTIPVTSFPGCVHSNTLGSFPDLSAIWTCQQDSDY